MTRDRAENSRAPPMRHHGFKMARRVSDTYAMCNCFTLSCYTNVLFYRNIHFSKIYLRMLKLQQKSLVHVLAERCILTFIGLARFIRFTRFLFIAI